MEIARMDERMRVFEAKLRHFKETLNRHHDRIKAWRRSSIFRRTEPKSKPEPVLEVKKMVPDDRRDSGVSGFDSASEYSVDEAERA